MSWKLVRRWTPEALNQWSGPRGRLVEITEEGFVKFLHLKLVEELDEYITAETPDELLDELADVYDVITTLSDVLGLEAIARAKREKIGPLAPLIWSPDEKDEVPPYAKGVERGDKHP
jgi:predicted house-cleaning noncanonical NTP pyrophosphatase (MazG superfamily)